MLPASVPASNRLPCKPFDPLPESSVLSAAKHSKNNRSKSAPVLSPALRIFAVETKMPDIRIIVDRFPSRHARKNASMTTNFSVSREIASHRHKQPSGQYRDPRLGLSQSSTTARARESVAPLHVDFLGNRGVADTRQIRREDSKLLRKTGMIGRHMREVSAKPCNRITAGP